MKENFDFFTESNHRLVPLKWIPRSNSIIKLKI
jgi:hypothetical protein